MKKLALIISIIFMLCFAGTAYAEESIYAASLEGFLTLRLAPGEASPEITKIPACAKLKLLDTENTWGKVVFENKCGWINLSFTAESYKKAANSTGIAHTANAVVQSEQKSVVLYSLPSTESALGSEEKFVVPNGTILNIARKTESGWSLADMNGTFAWVQTEFTMPYSNPENENAEQFGISYVYALSPGGTGISLEKTPSSKNVMAVIPDCVKLTMRETQNGYAYVSYNGLNGWINLKHTADSYEEAVNNAGKSVKEEYVVVSEEDEITLMNIPSEFTYDGSFPEASVKKGETVFVLRQTDNGWSYISHGSKKGWCAPFTLEPAVKTEAEKIQLCTPYDVYVKSADSKGMKLYPDANKDEKGFVTIAECVRMSVITEKDGFGYVVNNYASGWADLSQTVATYEEALNLSDAKALPHSFYILKEETELYSLPTYSALCESTPLSLLSPGIEFTVFKEVSTGKRRWGLTEINGQTGWINLEHAKKISLPIRKTLILVLCAIIVAAIIIWGYKKKRKIKKED